MHLNYFETSMKVNDGLQKIVMHNPLHVIMVNRQQTAIVIIMTPILKWQFLFVDFVKHYFVLSWKMYASCCYPMRTVVYAFFVQNSCQGKRCFMTWNSGISWEHFDVEGHYYNWPFVKTDVPLLYWPRLYIIDPV